MINSLTLDNFKAHKHTELTFERLTVLVGPNGGGKTSVLEALKLMGALPHHGWGGNEETLIHKPVEASTFGIRIEGASEGSSGWYLSFEAVKNAGAWGISRELSHPSGSPVASTGNGPLIRVAKLAFYEELRTPGIFRFDARRIAEPGDFGAEQQVDGRNTASTLARLKLADDAGFDAILKGLRSLIPAVRSVRMPPMGSREDAKNALEFDFAHADRIPASAVSDGTLVLLAILTALHRPDRPRLLLIDDIEQTLHPTAQMELMDFILNLLDQDKDLQIVATTHSPFILDRLDPKQVRVFFPREDGSIAVRPLTDHPDAKRAVGTLTAGQIWTLDPEKWVLENA